MGIPKIVHYCWFGPKELPDIEKKYIDGWKKLLPDYKFILWSENNFDINSNMYVKEAYENKKYAFVADYVRICALLKYGGIYMDTDVELLKSFDEVLYNNSFIGFENRTMVGTGIIGAEPNNNIFKLMLDYYDTHKFIDENGVEDTTTNVKILNKILLEKGLVPQNQDQILDGLHIYERRYFCPKKINENEFNITDDSITIHHFNASWLTEREKKRGRSLIWRNFCRPVLRKLRTFMEKICGENATRLFETKLRYKIK